MIGIIYLPSLYLHHYFFSRLASVSLPVPTENMSLLGLRNCLTPKSHGLWMVPAVSRSISSPLASSNIGRLWTQRTWSKGTTNLKTVANFRTAAAVMATDFKSCSSASDQQLVNSKKDCDSEETDAPNNGDKLKNTIKAAFDMIKKDFGQLKATYRTTNFEETWTAAPRHVFWTAVVSIAPLAVQTLTSFVTLSFGGYSTIATVYASLYVVAANGWWLQAASSDSLSSFWSIVKTLEPALLCAVAVTFLPQPLAATVVLFASFRTTCWWVVRRDGVPATVAALPLWCKSLVLLMYAIYATCLTLAMISSIFS